MPEQPNLTCYTLQLLSLRPEKVLAAVRTVILTE
jgi:hypothetical protein